MCRLLLYADGLGKNSPGKICTREVRPSEVRPSEICTREICTREICIIEEHHCEICVSEIGFNKSRTAQIGTFQV